MNPSASSALPGSYMAAEVASQPETWTRAAAQAVSEGLLPPAGARVAIVGCGTSWFMAQSYAALRESLGLGETDPFAASEAFLDRAYDAVILLSRSGTTTEVLEIAAKLRGRVRTIGITGDPATSFIDAVDDIIVLDYADEQSVVQTRFATSALAYLRASLGQDLQPAIEDARTVLAGPVPEVLVTAEQFTFIGTGWTVGLANEAALKLREATLSWSESYPAKEYRHGPISIAAPGRVTWAFGELPDGIADDTLATGAHFQHQDLDPMASLVLLHRVASERAARFGLDPDHPRNLTRSVILTNA